MSRVLHPLGLQQDVVAMLVLGNQAVLDDKSTLPTKRRLQASTCSCLIVPTAALQGLEPYWFVSAFHVFLSLFSSVYLLLPNFPFFFFVILRFTSFFPCFYLCFFISFHHLYFDFLRFFLHFLCFSLCFFVSFHHLSLNSCLLFSARSVLY